MDIPAIQLFAMSYHQAEPVAGIRQMLIFPVDESHSVGMRGLLRQRHLLVELEAGRVFSLKIARGWNPDRNNLAMLAETLAQHDGQACFWAALQDNLGWRLETTLTLDNLNLADPGLDQEAIRAAALESSLGQGNLESSNPACLQERTRRIEQQISIDLAEAMNRFISGLDPRIIAASRLWPDGMPVSRYNWLVGRADHTLLWRLQAAEVFPALIPLLAGELGMLQPGEQRLMAVIDAGRPLVKGLADVYGVQKSIARHALTIPSWLLGDTVHGRPGVLLRGMADLPPERYPHSESNWRMYVRLLYELLPSLTGRPASSRLNAAFLPAISKRGWEVTERKLEKVGLDEDGADLLRRFVAACSRTLAWEIAEVGKVPQAASTTLASRILDAALVSVGVVNLAAIAHQWPTLVGRSSMEHKAWWDQLRGKSWPAVIDTSFEWEDCRVVALTRPEELVEEGEAMGHCVGTYVQSCLDGESFIFSVRRGDSVRMGTAELAFKPIGTSNQHRIAIRQFKGHGNSQVCDQGARVLAAFKRYLEQDEGQTRISGLLREIAKTRKWRRQGIVAKRIDHEVEADAMRQLENPRLKLDALLVAAIDILRGESELPSVKSKVTKDIF